MALLLTLLIVQNGLQPSPALAQLEAVEIEPEDGAVMREPPDVYHFCFSEPVEIERPDWEFTVTSPDGTIMGTRTVFDPSGDCVDIFPGLPAPVNEGEWVFDWRVRSQASGEEASGKVIVEVDPNAPTPTPEASPGADGTDEETGDGDDTAAIAVVVAVAVGIVAVAGVLFGLRRWGTRQRPPL